MNIIDAWMTAEAGDSIEIPFSQGKRSYQKNTARLIPGLYDAVDYAKKVGCLSSNTWKVVPGMRIG